jgi:hypothetical protein
MNPLSSMEKMLKQMPGMGDSLTQVMKQVQSANTAVMRTRMAIFLPGLAAMMKQMPADKNPFGGTFDADTPMMEVNQELAELSTAAVSEKLFQIPEAYKATTAREIVRDMLGKFQPAAAKK